MSANATRKTPEPSIASARARARRRPEGEGAVREVGGGEPRVARRADDDLSGPMATGAAAAWSDRHADGAVRGRRQPVARCPVVVARLAGSGGVTAPRSSTPTARQSELSSAWSCTAMKLAVPPVHAPFHACASIRASQTDRAHRSATDWRRRGGRENRASRCVRARGGGGDRHRERACHKLSGRHVGSSPRGPAASGRRRPPPPRKLDDLLAAGRTVSSELLESAAVLALPRARGGAQRADARVSSSVRFGCARPLQREAAHGEERSTQHQRQT